MRMIPWRTNTPWMVWLVVCTSTCTTSSPILQRRLPAHTDNINVWGVQSGPANGHSDAGGMIYDVKRDALVLVGTTHDNQFFPNDVSGSVDCYVATVTLPPLDKEISLPSTTPIDPAMGGMAQIVDWWQFSSKQRIKTDNRLDRCDFITAVWGETHDHYFAAGTLALAINADNIAMAVNPFVMDMNMTTDAQGTTSITAGPQLKVLQVPVNPGGATPIYPTVNNDLIIPSAITSHGHSIYMASIHRILVVHEASSNAKTSFRIGLGISKLNATDLQGEAALAMEWRRIYETAIIEAKSDDVQSVMSGYFDAKPGVPAILEKEHQQIQDEISELEAAHEDFNEEALGHDLDTYRHAYRNDGVLISGVEFIDTENEDEQYLLISGSAPGVTQELEGGNNTHMSGHPFFHENATYVGDWDGFIAKIGAKTGEVLRPPEPTSAPTTLGAPTDYRPGAPNTWSYTVQTQPRRDDFVQSICVPRVWPELWPHDQPYYPTVAYAIGTTTGIYNGTETGGAFVLQLDLETMNVNWKKQLSGMNVHGLACQVLVDVASHGTTDRAENKDLLYIAGEVHGSMKVDFGGGRTVQAEGHGETDIWVAQLQARDGTINWFHQIGTSQQDRLAKNVNNPTLADGKEESAIGDTGSGQGALVLDRHGNALVYGTTTGPFAKEKTSTYRDIFVLRLHRDDGSYRAVIPPPTNETSSPIGSSGGTSSPGPPLSSGSSGSQTKPVKFHAGAVADTSVNYGIVVAGLLIPLALGIVIIVATRRPSSSLSSMEMTPTYPKYDMDEPFPPQEQPLPFEVEPATFA